MPEECVISLVLSHHNKNLKQRTSVTALGWISVTVPCYRPVLVRKQMKIHPRGTGACQPKRCEEKRQTRAFWLLFLYVLFLPPGPALCKLGQPGVLFVLPEVLTLVLGPSFVLFSWVFPSMSFNHHHSGLLFPILTT